MIPFISFYFVCLTQFHSQRWKRETVINCNWITTSRANLGRFLSWYMLYYSAPLFWIWTDRLCVLTANIHLCHLCVNWKEKWNRKTNKNQPHFLKSIDERYGIPKWYHFRRKMHVIGTSIEGKFIFKLIDAL